MKITTGIILSILFLSASLFAQKDVEGSKDHPLISRYPGSSIVYYDEQEYNNYSIATGPVTGYRTISEWMDVEGKFTRLYYELPGDITIAQIFANYKNAMEKAGFEILAKGMHKDRNVSKEIGGGSWLGTFYAKNNYPTNSDILMGAGSSTSGGTCYIAGKLGKNNGTAYVIIAGKEYSNEKKIYMIDIIEEAKLEDDLIAINADAMLKGIKADGKIALYGIYFEFDKADLKPESAPTLQEIANLLSNDSSLKLYVVGHTDMKGKLDYNISLSKKRAEAVVKELTTNYGVKSNRLTADGVGPLAPVSTNETEDGRKFNRRVELVAK